MTLLCHMMANFSHNKDRHCNIILLYDDKRIERQAWLKNITSHQKHQTSQTVTVTITKVFLRSNENPRYDSLQLQQQYRQQHRYLLTLTTTTTLTTSTRTYMSSRRWPRSGCGRWPCRRRRSTPPSGWTLASVVSTHHCCSSCRRRRLGTSFCCRCFCRCFRRSRWAKAFVSLI